MVARNRRRTFVLVAVASLLIGFVIGGSQAWLRRDTVDHSYGDSRIASGDPRVTSGGAASPSGHYRRGLWVVRHSLRGPDAIDAVIDTAVDIGADTLFVQVNGRMEAYYRSTLLPTAGDVAPDFDPLDYVIRRAREAGIEVHAWINAFTAGMLTERPAHPDHVLNRRPDWVTVDRAGRSLWDYGWQEAQVHVPARMLDPGVPAVQRFVTDVVLEVVDSYAVDGVHLDYIRYPSRRFGYHPESVRRFTDEHGFNPMTMEQDAVAFVTTHGRDEFQRRLGLWDDWRRRQVTSLVADIARAIDSRDRDITFSVAVGADAGDAVAERLQDWPAWLEHGVVDGLVLMAYSADTARVRHQVEEAVVLGRAADLPIYAGVGAYMLNGDADLLRRQLDAVRAAGAAGVSIFSYDTLLERPAFKHVLQNGW